MMRAHSLAWTLSTMPGNSRRSSRASPQRVLRDQATRVCAAQYGPRPTIGLPQRVNGRFSPSGHWQPRGIGGGGGAATAGGGFSGGGRRGGMPHYVAVTPSGCHTGRAEVSDVMQECSTPAARRSVTSPPSRCGCCRTSSSGSADGSAACRRGRCRSASADPPAPGAGSRLCTTPAPRSR